MEFKANLLSSYDPGVDSVEAWSQKIKLLLFAWPETKLKELATRIVLNMEGSAFQKLQLHQSEIFTGDVKGIEKIVSLVGGSFGQVELEKRFEIAEKAPYRCVQKQDETADSFLARSDVAWTELLSKKMTLAELQAYIVLRGSCLSGEDKKRACGIRSRRLRSPLLLLECSDHPCPRTCIWQERESPQDL